MICFLQSSYRNKKSSFKKGIPDLPCFENYWTHQIYIIPESYLDFNNFPCIFSKKYRDFSTNLFRNIPSEAVFLGYDWREPYLQQGTELRGSRGPGTVEHLRAKQNTQNTQRAGSPRELSSLFVWNMPLNPLCSQACIVSVHAKSALSDKNQSMGDF